LRQDGSPIVTVDADINTRYERVQFTANTVRHWKRLTIIPTLRIGVGHDLPNQETFFWGGYNSFPGLKVFEVRGTIDNTGSLLLKYKLAGSLSLTFENVGGAIVDEDSVRADRQQLPYICLPGEETCAQSAKVRGRHADGNRYGLELETLLGPIRVDIGHNTNGRQQATFTIGTWR